MPFNAVQFCTDYNIEYSLTGKNVSNGWVGIHDIYEKDTSFHMGINPAKAYVYSWKSGWHPLHKVVSDLLGVSTKQAQDIVKQYSSDAYYEQILNKKRFIISEDTLKKSHMRYLRKRGFNATYIRDKYDLRSIGTRIVIPVYYNNKIVSYQESETRYKFYKSCPKDMAIINYKDILYNVDNSTEDFVVVVEGILDVWRMDDNCVSTFGISYTKNQLVLLTKRYKHVIIMYDNEPEAQRQAKRMAVELDMMGVDVTVDTDFLKKHSVKDAGELQQEVADEYMESLLR
jgi:hypothetical protein